MGAAADRADGHVVGLPAGHVGGVDAGVDQNKIAGLSRFRGRPDGLVELILSHAQCGARRGACQEWQGQCGEGG